MFRFECQRLGALAILGRIDPEFFLELLADRHFESLVPVEATEVQIAAAGDDADFVFLIADQRQIECPAAEIDDHDRLRRRQLGKPNTFGPEDEAQRCRDGFVDDVNVLESRPLDAEVEDGLGRRVVEVHRHAARESQCRIHHRSSRRRWQQHAHHLLVGREHAIEHGLRGKDPSQNFPAGEPRAE